MAVTQLRAWDAFGNQLRIEAMRESWTDSRRELAEVTRRVIRLYEGDQDPELFRRFDVLFKHPRLNARYKELSHTHNVVKPLVEKVATVGKRPVRVIWTTKKDQELWDEISCDRLGSKSWNAFIPFLSREVKLTKNVVVTVGWDAEHGQIELNTHYPHTCDVGWYDGNQAWDYPDTLTILNMPTPQGQRWDAAPTGFPGQHYDFTAGYVYTITDQGAATDAQPLPIVNGKPLRPYAPFRSTLVRGRGYWVWDGQRELIKGQNSLNWLWTCEAVTIHFGAFKMPLLKGRWTDDQGKLQEILLDQTELLLAPVDPLGKSESTVEWIGPDNGSNLAQIRESRAEVMRDLASSLHMDGEAVVSDNHGAASGYSLRVQKWALNESHDASVETMRPEIENLVSVIRDVWNVSNHGTPFTAAGDFEVIIPGFRSGETQEEEVRADAMAVENGFVARRSVVVKHNPGLTTEELETLLEESARPSIADAVQLVQTGVITTQEARALLGIEERLKGGPDAPGAADPGDSTNDTATGDAPDSGTTGA